MDTHEWVDVAQRLGVASACLVALSLAVWRVLVWVGNRIDKWLDRHLTFLDRLTASLQRLEDNAANSKCRYPENSRR